MAKIIVLDARQIAALASPTRGAVFERMAARGKAAAVDIAADTGIAPATALYHLKQLAAVGLVVEAGERPSGKRPATLFRPVSMRLQLPTGGADAGARVEAVIASLRKSMRDVVADGGRAMHVLKIASRLNPDDLAAFQAMLEEAAEFAKSRSRPEGKDVAWISLVCPPRRRGVQ